MATVARFKLNEFQTQILLPLDTRGPGVITQEMLIQGNSLLSSVFIHSADPGATLDVRYFDFTTGELGAERYDLTGHPQLTNANAGETDRRTVTKIHNKPHIEVTVAGGNVRFGVLVTVVNSFASDLDQSLQFDNEIADLGVDKGVPVMTYDEALGRFFFLRGEQGVIPVAVSEAGDAVHLSFAGQTTPGVAQDLIDDTVPIGKVRKLTQCIVTCRQPATYYITSDGVIIGSGRTGPANIKDVFSWNPRSTQPAGKNLKVTFESLTGTPITGVEVYLMGSDIDV